MKITKDTVKKLFETYNNKHLKSHYGRAFVYNIYKIAVYEMGITKKQIRDCKWRMLIDDNKTMNWHNHNAELYVKMENGYVKFNLKINSKGVIVTEIIE